MILIAMEIVLHDIFEIRTVGIRVGIQIQAAVHGTNIVRRAVVDTGRLPIWRTIVDNRLGSQLQIRYGGIAADIAGPIGFGCIFSNRFNDQTVIFRAGIPFPCQRRNVKVGNGIALIDLR